MRTAFAAALVSLLYFADIFVRSAGKPYWYDELFTVYLCRLPSFVDTWKAVLHGADLNPPLFYLLTRTSQSVFGQGQIATRLPEALGVWLLGISLFIFVSRRLGALAGAVAGIFPFFTLAKYYAFEARPHGVVVGWCGLAFICWQQCSTVKHKYVYHVALFLSLLAAMLSHVYAVFIVVPFALAELYSIYTRRRLNWSILLAVASPPFIALPFYLPMIRSYRSLIPPGSALNAAAILAIAKTITSNLLEPAMVILLIAIACVAFEKYQRPTHVPFATTLPVRELIVAISFTLLPFLGLAEIVEARGVFYDRYFLSSIAGWSILLALAVSGRRVRSWAPGVLAAAMVILMLGDLAVAGVHLLRHSDFALVEPSSHFLFAPDRDFPMARHSTLQNPEMDEDILVLRETDYLYLYTNASPAVVAHLYDGALEETPTYRGYQRLAREAHLDLKMSLLRPFLSNHDRFLVYGSDGGRFVPGCGDCIDLIQKAGFLLTSEARDADGILYAYERRQATEANR